jgi:hypothetical protein
MTQRKVMTTEAQTDSVSLFANSGDSEPSAKERSEFWQTQ